MKKLLFLLFFICEPCFSKTVTLEIPDQEIAIVENDVIDAVQWLKDAWAGKVNNCKKRLIKQEIDRSLKAQEAIPAGDQAIINKIFSDPNYKSRAQLEATTVVEPIAK